MLPPTPLPWLEVDAPFPDPSMAWGPNTPFPGLLAAGGSLSSKQLQRAYANGIFPWFSDGQPILWWSTAPRMVLNPPNFRLHPSFKKTLRRFAHSSNCQVTIDKAFDQVIEACAGKPRPGQNGTWIVPEMVTAYKELHQDGFAHSFETWQNGVLVGGLYCVAIGQAVFGESMFANKTDASKIALAGLVSFCIRHGIQQIDCQQNTQHLRSLGAAEISRELFLSGVQQATQRPSPAWEFEDLYWRLLLDDRRPISD